MAEATLIARIVAKGTEATRSAIAGITAEIRKLRVQTGLGMERVVTGLEKLGEGFQKAGTGAKEAGQKTKGFFDSLNSGGGILGNFRAALLDAFIISGLVSQFVGQIGRAARALAELTTEAQKTNIAFTAANIKLETSTNSVEEYNAAVDRLRDTTRQYGVGLLASTESLAEFLAATKRSNLTFEERIALFESTIKVARVLNLSQERLKLTFLALTQIASKGAAALEEVRRQLGDQIPGSVPRLADALGKTVPQLFDDLKAKAVSSEEAIRGFIIAFEDIASEKAFEATQTLAASIGRLNREIDLLKLAFGEATEEGVKAFVDSVTVLARDLANFSDELGDLTTNPLLEFNTAIVGLSSKLAVFIQQVRDSNAPFNEFDVVVSGISNSFFGWAQQIIGLNNALEPFFELIRQSQLKRAADDIAALADKLANTDEAAKNLTDRYKKLEDGRARAVTRLLEIEDALRKGLLSQVEAERERAKVYEQVSEKILRLRQEEQREFDRLEAERKKALDEAVEGAKQSAEEQAEAEREIQDAIEETTDAARSQGQLRVEIGADLARRLVEFEVKITDDVLREFQRQTKGIEAESGEREKIEEGVADKVEDIQRKLYLKLDELREEQREKLREAAGKEEEINEEAREKQIEEYRKANEAILKVVEDGRKKLETSAERLADKRAKEAKKAADAEIKETERSVKKQQELLAKLQDNFTSLRDEIRGVFEGEGEGEISGPSLAAVDTGPLADALRELDELQSKSLITLEESNRQWELSSQIIPRLRAELLQAGDASRGLSQDLLGDSEKLAKIFQNRTVGAAEFREELRNLGPAAQASIGLLLNLLDQAAAAGNLNEQRANEFGDAITRVFADAGVKVDFFGQQTLPRLGEEFQALQEQARKSGLPEVSSDATAAAGGVGELGGKVAVVTKNLREMDEAGEESRISIRSVGEESEEAVGGVEVLRDEAGRLKIAQKEVEESATAAAKAEEELGKKAADVAEKAKIPQEVIDSITNLGATVETVAPLLDPLVEPLAGIAESVTNLSTAIPLLPEPLGLLAQQFIILADEAVLKPLSEGLSGLVEQFAPLSETIPIVAEAQERLNTAATESEQPIGVLKAALESIAAEELTGRLTGLADEIDRVSETLTALGSQEGGFKKAEDAAVAFGKAVAGDDGVLAKIRELANYLDNEFARVLLDLAVGWNAPIDAVKSYVTKLEELKDSFPEIASAAEEMFQRMVSAGNSFLAVLDSMSQKLSAIERQAERIFGEGGGGGFGLEDIPPTPVKTFPAPGSGGQGFT